MMIIDIINVKNIITPFPFYIESLLYDRYKLVKCDV